MKLKAASRYLVYLAVFLLFTAFFSLVNFPVERTTLLVNQALGKVSEGKVSARTARLVLPFSLKVEGLVLEGGQGPLDLGQATVTPGLLALITGKREADVRFESPLLTSRFSVSSRGSGGRLAVSSARIDLSRLPETQSLPFQLTGNVEGTADLQTEDWAQGIFTGETRLTSGSFVAGGGLLDTFGMAPLTFSRLSAVATIENNVMTLGETAVDGDIAATARGTVRLAPSDYTASRLDLVVELTPGPQYRERLLPVFSLMGARPRADGTVSIRVRGTVGRPAITM